MIPISIYIQLFEEKGEVNGAKYICEKLAKKIGNESLYRMI